MLYLQDHAKAARAAGERRDPSLLLLLGKEEYSFGNLGNFQLLVMRLKKN